MIRRPWPIVILAAFQCFFEPFSNLFMNSRLSHVTAKQYFNYFIHQHDWLSMFYLFALPVVMGASVYLMKKWSFWVFTAGASWMLIENFAQVKTGDMPLWIAITMYLGNLGFVGYFLIPQVKAPFMNPRLRWWETKPRFYVSWPCRLNFEGSDNVGGRVEDFSEGGVFVSFERTVDAFQTGVVIPLRFGVRTGDVDELLTVESKIVFSRPVGNGRGYGFQFVDRSPELRKKIKVVARDLKKKGVQYRGSGETTIQAFLSWGKRLLTTGHGLLPEADGAPKVPRPSVTVETTDTQKSA
jgi:hypothetical protein